MSERFWMCYVEGSSGEPAVKLEPQGSYRAAREEAGRLAAQGINRKVYVLESLGYCELASPPVAWTSTKRITQA